MKLSHLINLALLLALIYGGYVFLGRNKEVQLPKYGNYLSCIGTALDLRTKVTSELYLLKSAIDNSSDPTSVDRLAYGGIFFQNLYTFSHLPGLNPNLPIKSATLSDGIPAMRILKKEDAAYPFDAEVDTTHGTDGMIPAQKDYVKKLSEIRFIKKGGPAIKITYEFENDLFLCSGTEQTDFLKQVPFIQPADPFAAYFAVPVKDRKIIINEGREASAIVNPCQAPSAVTPGAPNPFSFWNEWLPFAEGTSGDGKKFNCHDYYKVGEAILKPQISFTENKPKDIKPMNLGNFEKLDRPLKIAVLAGASENFRWHKFEPEEVLTFTREFLASKDIYDAKKKFGPIKKKYDPSFFKSLWMLKNLTEQMEIKKVSPEVTPFKFSVQLDGKFKLSRKDARIKVIVAPNNPRAEGSDEFNQAMAREFLSNDVFIYDGHINGGAVMENSVGKFHDEMLAHQDKKITYQLTALYSCSASFFFHPDKLPKVEGSSFKRDLIRTGPSFIGGGGSAILALIGQVDTYLYNQSYIPFAFWAKTAKSDNFFLLSNH